MSVLLLEAFYGGSHKQLVDLLKESVEDCVSFTLPAKKWHWRARTSALYFMQAVPASSSYRVLFTSSVLNLAELVALRPDLARLKKVLYFHENQLVYPVRKSQERDFQYGYNQILSCMVADVVVFNSAFNMKSFLSSISTFMKTMPDHRPKDLDRLIRPKCRVLHFPIRFPDVTRFLPAHKRLRHSLRCDDIHAPATQSHVQTSAPSCPELTIDSEPPEKIVNVAGPQQSLEPMSVTPCQETLQIQPMSRPCGDERGNLQPLHIVWPHRWLEAVHCGCYPLCPKALVYPEIVPATYLYSTPEQLCKRLQDFCKRPQLVRHHVTQVNLHTFSWDTLGDSFRSLLGADSDRMLTEEHMS
ncbi:glycosyltransferase-like domain-containing protein 1 isoform X2 [Sinocyclocheilus grahami]|uniref:glycosyltransferase-like domain-containing protein 1 isoform X2 n=1 Tax=Sinocyclocheilus grahami TaxID=75366 RepID=UPI0007AD4D54|nr:PREDICTED: glycosyltransferase-like domain-containing protein 1 isoform X2 [Sinocyclocheilus grahami]